MQANVSVLESQASTVLYVDDEPSARKMFKKAFPDFQVVTAKDAEQAMHVLEQKGDDVGVLITDHFMPGKLGSTLLSQVQDKWPSIVRLLTTVDPFAASKNLKGGTVFNYVAKPWNLNSLKQQLIDALVAHQNYKHDTNKLVNALINEVQTSLAAIKHRVAYFDDYWLLQLDFLHKQSGASGHQSKKQYAEATMLKTVNDAVSLEVNKAEGVLSVLFGMVNSEANLKKCFSYYSMKECLKTVLSTTSFVSSPQVDANNDFVFYGSNALFACVISHLLTSADDGVSQFGKGSLSLSLERGDVYNRVYFTDTSKCMDNKQLPGMFFCQQIMHFFDGNLYCDSIECGHTTFVLEFPLINKAFEVM